MGSFVLRTAPSWNRITTYKIVKIMKKDSKITYDSVLCTIDFCTMPGEKLLMLIDYLGHTEVIKNSECEQKIKEGKCVEKRWCWYDELIVTPKEIFFASDPYPRRSIFTAENYAKLFILFNGAVLNIKENIKITETLSDGTQKESYISDIISRFIVETAEKYNEKSDDITIRLVGGNIFIVDACEVKEYKHKRVLMYCEINDL